MLVNLKREEVFYSVKTEPDSFIQVVEAKNPMNLRVLVRSDECIQKIRQKLYSFIDYEQFITNDENYPLLQFNWNVDEPQTMSKICPVLYENLWK
jgi:hypothetical protein